MEIISFSTDDISRIFLLSFIAFFLAIALTPIYTHFAYKYKWWKRKERELTVSGHAATVVNKLRVKRNLPRMAGIVGIIAISVVTLIFNLNREQTWLPLAALVGAGTIGLLDDVINIFGLRGGAGGLAARLKLGLITLVGAIGAWWFHYKLEVDTFYMPFIGPIEIGWLIVPLFILVVISTANAVNITDGIDGLAGGLLISAFSSFGVIALLQGQTGVAAFCMTVCGALLAYLWFNIAPARFQMGDVGSFAFGTSLGVVAMLTDSLVLLPLVGLVFVTEAGSVLLQLASKCLRGGKKIFIASPIHHHFEAIGWEKTKVTMRFWVIGQVCATMGIALAILGGLV